MRDVCVDICVFARASRPTARANTRVRVQLSMILLNLIKFCLRRRRNVFDRLTSLAERNVQGHERNFVWYVEPISANNIVYNNSFY